MGGGKQNQIPLLGEEQRTGAEIPGIRIPCWGECAGGGLLWLGREDAVFSICSAYFTAREDVVMI